MLVTKIISVGNCITPVDSIASNISDQVGYFHRVPEPWQWFQVRYIRPKPDISDPQSGSRTVVAGV
jgi:hypothetical protein